MSFTSNIEGAGSSGMVSARSADRIRYGAVAIGRDEGQRLARCLKSLSDADAVAYPGSGAIDNSAQAARQPGADVIEIDRGS
jgi:hypothetical protein